MIDAALHSQLEPCLQARGRGAAIAPRGRGLLRPMRCAQWNVAVLAELAEPGRMVLIPVVGRDGRVGDFMWQCASPNVTLLLGCTGEDLTGRTLTQVLRACHLRDVLFKTCHQAFLSRSPQTAAVNGDDWQGKIDAQPSSAGLTAALTSSSAIARLVAAQHALRELEQSSNTGNWSEHRLREHTAFEFVDGDVGLRA